MSVKIGQSIFLSLFIYITITLSSVSIADQLIIEPDRGRTPIIQAIDETRHSLQLVMYGFTDETLLNAILRQRHKNVTILLEQHPYRAHDENHYVIQQLNANHISWQGSNPFYQLIHQKTLIIDKHKAMIMTFNFTHSTFTKDRNFALVIDDPKKVRAIATVFTADWQKQPTAIQDPNLIYSPDNSRRVLSDLIHHAKHSIRIYAQSINDYKLVGALYKAAKKGVTIKILTSKQLPEKQAHYLARAGIQIHYSQHYYIHAKALLIDDIKAIIGSINLTRSSLENNRELSMISEDPSVIRLLRQTFDHDWQEEKSTNKLPAWQSIHQLFFNKTTLFLIKKKIKDITNSLINTETRFFCDQASLKIVYFLVVYFLG